jgi:hypothetical protein
MIYAALNLSQIIINSKMNFNVILAFRKCCEKNIKLNGINGVVSRYWTCEGDVVDECSWWIQGSC